MLSLHNAASAQPVATVPSGSANVSNAPRALPPIELADDIMRRLRRLGLNFNRNRIDRPYDPEGDLC